MKYSRNITSKQFGELSKYYKRDTSGEYDDPDFDQDIIDILADYDLEFQGWAVANSRYFDDLADDGLETVAIATDKSGAVDLYYIYHDTVCPITVGEVERVIGKGW